MTSTFLALARLNLLTDEEMILPERTPAKAANIHELNFTYLKFIDSFTFEENTDGRNTVSYTHLTLPTNREV